MTEATFIAGRPPISRGVKPSPEPSIEPASRPDAPHHGWGTTTPLSECGLSFVVPLKDEEATLEPLYAGIARECEGRTSFEVIFVDDGSRDGSWGVIRELARRHPERVRGLRFRCNRGKAAALTAGFRAAKGGVVFTMDADLQDDPAEIPRFLDRLGEGYDLVSGYKRLRHDPWHKVIPSRVFNAMLSRISGVSLHDHNCGFKCYRAEVVRQLTLHGEMHRMVPSLAAIKGFRASEVVVRHHPRKHGVSKYGIERFLRGFMDMLTVGFLRRYRERPSHLFGGVAAAVVVPGVSLMFGGVAASLLRAPGLLAAFAFACGLIFSCTGVIAGLLGILAELVLRGGLAQHWKLPIAEDTHFDRATSHRITDVPTRYAEPI